MFQEGEVEASVRGGVGGGRVEARAVVTPWMLTMVSQHTRCVKCDSRVKWEDGSATS